MAKGVAEGGKLPVASGRLVVVEDHDEPPGGHVGGRGVPFRRGAAERDPLGYVVVQLKQSSTVPAQLVGSLSVTV
ncbi:hypothetical protein, partial [Micromonospora sp. GCM10011541]|uniref:hypothetical protein n=1 Tax=Micromonospora sp. GCM10011541 TaxID=3317336 RepID=UPI003622C326